MPNVAHSKLQLGLKKMLEGHTPVPHAIECLDRSLDCRIGTPYYCAPKTLLLRRTGRPAPSGGLR